MDEHVGCKGEWRLKSLEFLIMANFLVPDLLPLAVSGQLKHSFQTLRLSFARSYAVFTYHKLLVLTLVLASIDKNQPLRLTRLEREGQSAKHSFWACRVH